MSLTLLPRVPILSFTSRLFASRLSTAQRNEASRSHSTHSQNLKDGDKLTASTVTPSFSLLGIGYTFLHVLRVSPSPITSMGKHHSYSIFSLASSSKSFSKKRFST